VLFLSGDDSSTAKAQGPSAPGSHAAQAAAKKKTTMTFSAAPIITPSGGGAGAVLRF
jgi:hypothetical protein